MQKQDLLDEAIHHHQNGNIAKAQKIYQKLLKKNNTNPDIWHLLGLVEYQKNNFYEAIKKIQKAISFNPQIASFYSNLGLCYFAILQYDKAIKSYQKALKLQPNYPEALNNLANVLSENNELNDALAYYKKAIELNPSYFDALCNLANCFFSLDSYDEALHFYQASLKINPNHANSYTGIAMLMKKLNKYPQSKQYFEKALSLQGLNSRFILGEYYEVLRKLCIWDNIDHIEATLTKSALSNDANCALIEPFNTISILRTIDSKQERFLIERYVENKIYPISKKINPTQFANRKKHTRIKIAYISPNFYNQASMHLVNGIFDKHDKDSFELFLYALDYKEDSYYYQKAKKDAEHFIDLKMCTFTQILEKIREDEIDILIDLRSHGDKSCAEITASKAAPIQVSFINFAGTTGNRGVDYIIGDKNIINKDDLDSYSESIVYMPNCCMVTDDKQSIAQTPPIMKEKEILENNFVFCNFNGLYKIEPTIFKIWMNILKQVENSILWLLSSNETAQNNLLEEAQKQGIDPNRIIFADMIDKDLHLARMQYADLFLDTLYYNAHTTAIDSLWAGVPILTVYGETFAARVASSILKTANLEELICTNCKDYEQKAVNFATNSKHFAIIKENLQLVQKSPLFDTQQYVLDLEQAYIIMYERFLKGLQHSTITL